MTFSSLLLFVVCLLVSFLYSGIEAGLLSMSRARLRSRIHQGERGAMRLGRLLGHPGRLLATVLLVTNFADVAALVLITDAFVWWLGVKGYAVAGVVMLPVYLLVLQLLPKSLFRRFPYRALAALAGLLEWTSRVLSPLLVVGRWLLGRTLLAPLPAAGMEKGSTGLFRAREDLKTLAAEGERTGALTPAEHGMIDNVIDFGAVPVGGVMRPLPEAFRLPPGVAGGRGTTATENGSTVRVADLLEFARERGLDEVLVVDAAGELAGLLDVFLLLLERDPQRDASAALRRPPLVVAPGDPALRVLRRLRAVRLPSAVVREGDAANGSGGGGNGRLVGMVRTVDLTQRLVRQRAGAREG